MKCRFLLLNVCIAFFLFIAYACSTGNKVNENDLKTYLETQIKTNDSTAILEDFKFIKLDTIPLKSLYEDIFIQMVNASRDNQTDIQSVREDIERDIQMQRLTAGLDRTLFKNSNDDFKRDLAKFRAFTHADSLLGADLDFINAAMAKADSVKPVMYNAKSAYTIRKKDKSIEKDTAYIKLDTTFNILSQVEYEKRINNLFVPKSKYRYSVNYIHLPLDY